jgi:hypothetical protein
VQAALEQLHSEEGDLLAVVAYHWGTFQTPDTWPRANYYGVYGTPWVWFDGLTEFIGSGQCTYTNFRNTFDARTTVSSPLSMQITRTAYDGSTGQGTVQVDILNESGSAIDATLILVVTGDHAVGNWGAFTEVKSVALDVFPDADGIAVSIPAGGTFQTTESFQVTSTPYDWRNEPCTVVGFVQDDVTSEILQAAVQHEVTAIELASFAARVADEGVVLSWTTLSEEGNAGFRVYRSDGREYLPLFDGLIPGGGTTSVPTDYTYTDGSVEAGRTYWYKLADVSLDGAVTFHGPIQVDVASLRLEPLAVEALPTPARESSSLRFSVPTAGLARVSVFDVRGRLIRELLATDLEAGQHVVQWDLLDEQGAPVSPGQYVCRVWVGHQAGSGRIVVAR